MGILRICYCACHPGSAPASFSDSTLCSPGRTSLLGLRKPQGFCTCSSPTPSTFPHTSPARCQFLFQVQLKCHCLREAFPDSLQHQTGSGPDCAVSQLLDSPSGIVRWYSRGLECLGRRALLTGCVTLGQELPFGASVSSSAHRDSDSSCFTGLLPGLMS